MYLENKRGAEITFNRDKWREERLGRRLRGGYEGFERERIKRNDRANITFRRAARAEVVAARAVHFLFARLITAREESSNDEIMVKSLYET